MKMKLMKMLLCTLLLSVPLALCGCKNDASVGNENNVGKNSTDDEFVGGNENIAPTATTTPEPQQIQFTETVVLPEKVTVCIDAGHGFSDSGCVSTYLDGYEAEITLEVANILKQKLELAGAEVILTHDGKTFPSAQEVKDYANKYNIKYAASEIKANNVYSAYERAVYCQALNEEIEIDFFISLHVNSIDGYPEISRYDIYYSADNPHAGALKDFCSTLQSKLDNRSLIHAEKKKDAMLVVKYAKFPAILFEMGFASNEEDAARMNSSEWRNSYCDLLTKEIINFALTN